MVICLGEVQMIAYGPADGTATPSFSCCIKIKNDLTFLVPDYPGCPGKEAIKWISDICSTVSYGKKTMLYNCLPHIAACAGRLYVCKGVSLLTWRWYFA